MSFLNIGEIPANRPAAIVLKPATKEQQPAGASPQSRPSVRQDNFSQQTVDSVTVGRENKRKQQELSEVATTGREVQVGVVDRTKDLHQGLRDQGVVLQNETGDKAKGDKAVKALNDLYEAEIRAKSDKSAVVHKQKYISANGNASIWWRSDSTPPKGFLPAKDKHGKPVEANFVKIKDESSPSGFRSVLLPEAVSTLKGTTIRLLNEADIESEYGAKYAKAEGLYDDDKDTIILKAKGDLNTVKEAIVEEALHAEDDRKAEEATGSKNQKLTHRDTEAETAIKFKAYGEFFNAQGETNFTTQASGIEDPDKTDGVHTRFTPSKEFEAFFNQVSQTDDVHPSSYTPPARSDNSRPPGPHMTRDINGQQEHFSHKTGSSLRIESNGTGSHYSSWRHWIGDNDWTWGQYGRQAEADFKKNEVVQITGSKGRVLGFATPMHSEKYGYGYEIRGTGESGDKPYYAFVDSGGNVNSFEQDPTSPNRLKKVGNSHYHVSEPSSLTQTNAVGPFTALTIAEQIHSDGESESLREHAGNAAKLEVGLRNTIGAAFGGPNFDPEIGPTWGDAVVDTLGEDASVSVRSEWGLKGGVTFGPADLGSTTFRFRTKMSPPRLGQDANGNPRAVMTVSFVEETEGGIGIGAGPFGASASHGTDSGISVDLIWDPQKQTFVLPAGRDGKLDKGKVNFFNESYAYADTEVGLSPGQTRRFKNLSGGVVSDFSANAGLNFDVGVTIATGRTLSWNFNNSQAIHAARGLSIFSKIPLLGHLGLGIAIAAGTADKDETYSTGGFIGTAKASGGIDVPKIRGGFGVTGGAFARTRIAINYPLYSETDDRYPGHIHPYPGPNDLTPEDIDEANEVLSQPNPADNPTNLKDLENYHYQTYRRERPFVNGVRYSGGREVKQPEYVNFGGRWFVVVNPHTGEIRPHDRARDGRINVSTLEPVSSHRPRRP